MIKTYLVPITDELIKAMEKGEAPSFLHCATCLDGLTNGEVIQKIFPSIESRLDEKTGIMLVKWPDGNTKLYKTEWWNAKWGE